MNRKIKIGLRIVISLFFLIIIASQINPTHVIQNVEKANPIYLFLGTLCFAGIIFFQALRLHLIVDQYTRSLGNTLQLILLGIFFNNLVPGSIGGDIYKIYHLKQKDSPLINAATYVILDRIIALSIITISGFIGILFLLPEILDTMARESIYLQIKKNIFLIMAFIAVAGGLSSVIFFKKKHVVLSWIKQKAREIKVALKIVTNQKLAKMVGCPQAT